MKSGMIVVITDGAYSDYRINGIYRVLRDFELPAERQRFLDKQAAGELDLSRRFLRWCLEEKILAPTDKAVEFYIGDYWELNLHVGDINNAPFHVKD